MKRVTTAMQNISGNKRPIARAVLTVAILGAWSIGLDAHGVSGKDAVFLQGLQGQAIGPLMYLGAKHMVTGTTICSSSSASSSFFTGSGTLSSTSACSPSATA